MIEFFLVVNRFGQTRIAQYYRHLPDAEKRTLEAELVRKCLGREDSKCAIFAHMDHKIIFRRYVSLYFVLGVSPDEQNEMAHFAFIHLFVETLNAYFEKVCELDIIMHSEKVYFVLEEMIQCGQIAEVCRERALEPLRMLDKLKSI